MLALYGRLLSRQCQLPTTSPGVGRVINSAVAAVSGSVRSLAAAATAGRDDEGDRKFSDGGSGGGGGSFGGSGRSFGDRPFGDRPPPRFDRNDRRGGSTYGSGGGYGNRSSGDFQRQGQRSERFDNNRSFDRNDRFPPRRDFDRRTANGPANNDRFSDRRGGGGGGGGSGYGNGGYRDREAGNDRRRDLERERPLRSVDTPLAARQVDDIPAASATATAASSKPPRDSDSDMTDVEPSAPPRRDRGQDTFRRGDHGRFGGDRRDDRPQRFGDRDRSDNFRNNDRSGSYGRDRFDNRGGSGSYGDRRREFGGADRFDRNDRFPPRRDFNNNNDRFDRPRGRGGYNDDAQITAERGAEQRAIRRQLTEASASLDKDDDADNGMDIKDSKDDDNDVSGSDGDAIETATDGQHDLVYGSHSVWAALVARRRSSFHRVYMTPPAETQMKARHRGGKPAEHAKIEALAKMMNIPIVIRDQVTLRKMTGDRPHGGAVLEASRVKPQVIDSLSQFADVAKRQVWVALDEVQDPQNMGAILRNCYYFGVTGVIICGRNSAALSPVTSKASSGAMEALPIYYCKSMPRFLRKTKEESEETHVKWRIMGLAVEPKAVDCRQLELPQDQQSNTHTILVVGNEGFGLRPLVREQCDTAITIVQRSLPLAQQLAIDDVTTKEPSLATSAAVDSSTVSAASTTAPASAATEPITPTDTNAPATDPSAANETAVGEEEVTGEDAAEVQIIDSLNVSNAVGIVLYQLRR